MMEVEEIRCFQHCDREKNILCFSVPLVCPLCGTDLTQSRLRIPPYLISLPFTDASNTKCCIVIKPTIGHFLFDLNNDSNLHIGLTNSLGVVYEFDERGVVKDDKNWTYCLCVELIDGQEQLECDWDQGLELFTKDSSLNREFYDENLNNCFDFVIEFLRWIGLVRKYPCLTNRSSFCEQMIVSATARAGKYISLYRQIKNFGVVIQNVSHVG